MTANPAARPLHPISVVAERTGLSPDVLRVWERRYGVVEPARDDAGRRLYSDGDIERLRLLGQATAGGRSIGQLLDLDTSSLAALVQADEAARWSVSEPVREPDVRRVNGTAGFVSRSLERARLLDAPGLEAELLRAAAVTGAGAFLESVVAPLFTAIGNAWHAGELTIAQEHMASAVARGVLLRLRESLPVHATSPCVVVATLSGERHEIGALLAAGAAALEGWRVVYLGVDLPGIDVARAARQSGARMVALSAVYAAGAETVSELRVLRDALSTDVAIVIGGAGVTGRAGADTIAGVAVLQDLAELRRRLAVR